MSIYSVNRETGELKPILITEHYYHYHIKVSDCPKCNSNLPISKTSDKGICKCEYCGKEVYVW